jgi:hypothetical protein
MKKYLILILFASTCTIAASAQSMGSSYTTAIGVKIYPGALSVKHFTSTNKAIEGLGYFWQYGFRVTGLYEIHGDINGAPGLKWYVGPGAHIGTWNDKWKKDYPGRESGLQLGIDGVLGLDYKFKGAPINLSFDWQPSFNFVGYNYFEGGWGGLGIRYTF